MVLRLARDLRPRGAMISQFVADAISQAVYGGMIPVMLASPRLKADQCERLIKLLAAHEAKSIDGYAEGIRAEYVSVRSTLDGVVHHQSELATSMGLKPGQSLVRAILSLAPPASPPNGSAPSAPPAADDDAIVARTTPEEVTRRVQDTSRYFRSLLALDGVPYAVRIEKLLAVKAPSGSDPLSRVVTASMQVYRLEAAARSTSRATASLRADHCLLALRRWQSSHRGSPKDLSSVARGAVLKSVPIDPYDGKPFKMAVVDGQPIIYSVGRDGKDDGGLVDSDRDQKPSGDLIYRLPPIEEKHALKP